MIRLHFIPTVGTLFHPDPLTRCQVEGDIKRVLSSFSGVISTTEHLSPQGPECPLEGPPHLLPWRPFLFGTTFIAVSASLAVSAFFTVSASTAVSISSADSASQAFSASSDPSLSDILELAGYVSIFRKVTKSRFSCPFCSFPVSPPLPAGAGPLPGSLVAPAGITRASSRGYLLG